MKKYSLKKVFTLLIAAVILLTTVTSISLVASPSFLERVAITKSAISRPLPPGEYLGIFFHIVIEHNILFVALIVTISILLVYFIVGYTLRKLNMLSAQFEKIGIENLSAPVSAPYTDNEINSMITAFNHMTAKLNETVSFQARYASNIAHEFRTPLSVIKVNIDLFNRKHSEQSEDCAVLLTLISSQITRLTALTAELMDMSRLDCSGYHESVEIETVLSGVVDDLAVLLHEKQIAVTFSFDSARAVPGNANLLYRAFYNIIHNAIKYSDSNTSILIATKFTASRLIVRIADQGYGIPDGKKAQIFTPFYTEAPQDGSTRDGLGLGLAITKAIIDTHNGTIEIENNDQKGTIFKISLPCT